MTHTITTNENLRDSRAIESVVHVDDKGRELYLRASHYAPRKAYMITIGRRVRSGNTVREVITMRQDERNPLFPSSQLVPTARYSAKALKEAHRQALNAHFSHELDQHVEWAKGARA